MSKLQKLKKQHDRLVLEAEDLRYSVNINVEGWLISTHLHYPEGPRFTAWKVEDSYTQSAMLSPTEILSIGKYTEEELEPVLEAIQEYGNAD